MKRWMIVLIWIGLIAVRCAPTQVSDEPNAVLARVELPTLVPSAVVATPLPTLEETLTPIPTLAETFTPVPSPTPLATETLPPTNTPRPSPTPIPSPTEAVVDRTCPDPPPRAPNYQRNVLGDEILPRPAADPLADRIWLKKPLPGGGRYLINMGFPYGWDGDQVYLIHNGVDTAVALGNPVLAVGDGTVVVSQSDRTELWGWRCDWYGQLVVIELDQTWLGQPIYALYGHVLNRMVEVGDRVEAGEQVAEVGFGGAAIAPHLHFELRVGSNDYENTRNPMLWIEYPPSRGAIVGRLTNPEGRPWEGVELTVINTEDDSIFFTTWSYMDDPRDLINSDEQLAENFVFTDVWAGSYRLEVVIEGELYTAEVDAIGGDISLVSIVTP